MERKNAFHEDCAYPHRNLRNLRHLCGFLEENSQFAQFSAEFSRKSLPLLAFLRRLKIRRSGLRVRFDFVGREPVQALPPLAINS